MSSATPGVHFLRRNGVTFGEHPYRYEERGGTRASARELGIDEHVVVKTLVMQDDERDVNGGRRGFLVSLAPSEIVRVLGATRVDVAVR